MVLQEISKLIRQKPEPQTTPSLVLLYPEREGNRMYLRILSDALVAGALQKDL